MGGADSIDGKALDDAASENDGSSPTVGASSPGSEPSAVTERYEGHDLPTVLVVTSGEAALVPSDPAGFKLRINHSTVAEGSSPHEGPARTEAERTDVAPPSPDPSSVLSQETSDGHAPLVLRARPVPVIDGYKILGELGRGGMGVVYKARQIRLDRLCALKMILGGAHASPEAAVRFLAEAQAIARLQHPNIVQIHHIGEAEGLPFFELEYIDSGGLDKALDGTPWPARKAAGLVELLAGAVAEAHRLEIVHRDLKPANILLMADGTPKITDFGLAKSLGTDSGLTATDSIMGSPSYMAPEQAAGRVKQLGPLTDIYALGAILYELLTGRPPFRGATILETLEQVKGVEPVPPSRLAPGLPRDLETIILKCLQKEPEKRYDSATALAEDLRRFLGGQPIRARPVPFWERAWKYARRRPALTAAFAVVLILLATLLGLGVWSYAEIRASRDLARAQKRAAQDERDGAVRNLYKALVGEARATRLARPEGYRRTAWGLLDQARRLDTPDRDRDALRREAVACMGDVVGMDPLVLTGFPSAVTRTAIHPRGTEVAIGLRDGSVSIRRPPGGDVLASWRDHPVEVSALAYADDGRTLIVGHADGSISVNNRGPGGQWARTRRAEAGRRILGIVVTPASRCLAYFIGEGSKPGGQAGDTLSIMDLADETVTTLDAGPGVRFITRVVPHIDQSVTLSPDGRLAAAGVEDSGSIKSVVWDIASRRELDRHPVPLGTLYSLAFSPDARLLALGCDNGLIVLETDGFRQQSLTRSDAATAVSFSPFGHLLASASSTGVIRLRDVSSNRELAMFKHPELFNYLKLAFSADGSTLASSSPGSVRVLTPPVTPERLVLPGHAGGVPTVTFSPDGKLLASTSHDRTVKLWDAATGALKRSISGFEAVVQSAAFSPDGRWLVTGEYEGRLRVLDVETGSELAILKLTDAAPIFGVSFRPDGDVVVAAVDQGMRAWRLLKARPEGEDAPRLTFERNAEVNGTNSRSLASSPDGRLAAYTDVNLVRLWDLERGQSIPLGSPGLLDVYHALAFLPDSRLGFVTRSRVVEFWDVIANRKAFTLGRGGEFGYRIATSPDGRLLAGEATVNAIALWDLQTREHLYTLREEASPIWSLAFSPDSRKLALGTSDGGLVVWDLRVIGSELVELGLDQTRDGAGR